ncbi:S-layer homology domain-containing protein [Brevibacillus massiliensis]|uniref:S-layer homology domain-containing protein n=1 Tax=Brevibacillus massiliensis TaxID=1118054 RepID=UPI0002E81E2B|nr:S-layer homology domain-containing protein [Brevibacillus massiliensis]
MHFVKLKSKPWLAAVMAFMLLVSNLFAAGAGVADAATQTNSDWTIDINDTDYKSFDSTKPNSDSNPIIVTNSRVYDVKFKYKDASFDTKKATVKVDNATVTTVPFSGDTVTLDKELPLRKDGRSTIVTIQPEGSSEIGKFYVKYVESYIYYSQLYEDVNLKIQNRPADGTGKSFDNPTISNSSTIPQLDLVYNRASDKKPSFEVWVGGVVKKTLGPFDYPASGNLTFQVKDIDLNPGDNTVVIYAVNTGEVATIYYRYNSGETPITVEGFGDKGKSISDPVIYGDSKITLTGYFGSDVIGSNLRLKITTSNGQTQDLSNMAPTISGSRYTFSDVNLQPGLNQISFYEKVGNITKEIFKFYVQYNNTPIVSNLKVEDTPLNDSALTVITIPSANRLTLNMEGDARNADTVEVTNTRTGDVIKTSASRTGVFSLRLPTQLGENELEIRAYNANKEVGVIKRKILVVTTSANDADLFYQVSFGGVELKPDRTVSVPGIGSPTTSSLTLSGQALIRFVETPGQQELDKFTLTIQEVGNSTNSQTFTVTATPGTSGQSNFSLYQIDSTVTGFLEDGKTYRVKLGYNYLTPDTNGDLTVNNPIEIANYQYEFTYADEGKPRFVSVTHPLTGIPLSTTGENIISESPYKAIVKTFKMGTSGIPDKSKISVYYNTTALTSGVDYEITNEQAVSGQPDYGTFLLQLNKLPSGQGKITIYYDKGGSDEKEISLPVNVHIAPYLQFTYVDKLGDVRAFEDGFTLQDENEIRQLDAKVYNYPLQKQGGKWNFTVKLNGTEIAIDDSDVNVSNGKNEFRLVKSKLAFKKGNNELKVELTDEPKVTFTYNVSFFTSKLPSIENVKLEVEQNNNKTELTKKTTDTSYRTEASFLRSFSFDAKNATRVYVEKNGKRIIDYRYKNGDWEIEDSQEYIKAKREASVNSELEKIFESRNFSSTSRSGSFKAEMSSSQNGSLVEEVQRAVTQPEDQDQLLALFPLTLYKGGDTIYTIVAQDDLGSVVRYDVTITQSSASWQILSPVKERETDQYIVVNTNNVPIRIFAEKADKVLFGKTEATVLNTTKPDFEYDDDLGRMVPQTYYVFEATVPLKSGLNTVKFTVQVGNNKYNDEVLIYNANAAVDGAIYRDVLGKKTSFSVFEKAFELKFPSGTVLLSPSDNRAGSEVRNPNRDIFTDVPLFFGIADRTTGQVSIPGNRMESSLTLDTEFNYASPLYYVDAGDVDAPVGRDPYFNDKGIINGREVNMDRFPSRYKDNLVPSKEGTLTIKYDPSIVNAANTILTVFYNDGGGWKNVGGTVSTSKKTITVPFQGFGYYMVMKTRETFDDVINHPFARNDMETLFAKGIMPNYSGNSFGANLNITRGEFATMIVKALDLPIKAGPYEDSNKQNPLEPTFSDVRPSRDTWDYQYEYIETAARAGIVRGVQPGYFRPDQPLTRQEAAIMITRAMNLKTTGTPDAAKQSLAKMYTDAQQIDYYALHSVLAVSKANIMNGEPVDPTAKKPQYRFKPTTNLTRAEMATITVRMMIQLKKLPKQ